ncbi:T9SS C-terminal target domain-containing protein [Flavobacterium cupreum]|uniref:T9SS C-terminal target domain-containing protein n=2 Tax=Flavobacterium TaxID=237 RepID=A0A434A8X8_9FLAO|nr:T9SS type A sorting domain-containing protein [Flavobacterium cupreum]RUT70772.1 T9SS C-terminal target domain-containing protein [Flavobacterium cupreum]
MKTKLLLLLLLANFSIYAQYTAIPDANFEKKLIALGIDSGTVDGQVLTSKVSDVTSLDVSRNSIADLTGIQDFTSLTKLDCSGNALTSINLTKNVNLIFLYIYSNQLTSLDISNNTALNEISAGSNQLTSIDFSKNMSLTLIGLSKNKLTGLDVSFLPSLITLSVEQNNLQNINVTNNSTLENLYVTSTGLTTLDISQNTALKGLDCDKNALTTLDLSHNSFLRYLRCSSTKVTSLDLSSNPLLESIIVIDNLLTSLNVSNNPLIWEFWCQRNKLTTIDVSSVTALKTFVCSDNLIETFDVRSNAKLSSLSCGQKTLKSVDVTQNPLLTFLSIDQSSQLTSIDISQNPLLNHIDSDNTGLTSIDLSHNVLLNDISINSPVLTELDLSKNTALTRFRSNNGNALRSVNLQNGNNLKLESFNLSANSSLDCIQVDDVDYATTNWSAYKPSQASFNLDCNAIAYTLIPDLNFEKELISLKIDFGTPDGKIKTSRIENVTSLDVSWSSIADLTGIQDFKSLTYLNCNSNSIASLDLSHNTKLEELYAPSNLLTSLNVSKNTALTTLTCSYGKLTTIDVSALTALKKLDIKNNALTTLDVSANTQLVNLYCGKNQLTALDLSANTSLKEIMVDSNKLTVLNVSKNPELTTIDAKNNQLATFDISTNDKLVKLNLRNNLLTSLNLKNSFNTNLTLTDTDFRINTGLKCIQVDDVTYSDANWANIKDVTAKYNLDCTAYTLIPDPKFEQKLIDLGIDKDGKNGKVLTASIAVVKDLNVQFSEIADLTGIEDFTSLEFLNCQYNNLTSLNLSKNLNLTELYCHENLLTVLDVAVNSNLTTLQVNKNKIKSLDLSKNKKLVSLNASENDLNYLNLQNGNNTAFTSVFMLKNPKLTCILVDDTSYAIAKWSAGKDVAASFNVDCTAYTLIPDANFEQKLINLGIDTDGKNGKVKTASIASVGTLDISSSAIANLTGIQDFASLTILNFSTNNVASYNPANNPLLTELRVDYNALTTLDISKNPNLVYINFSNNNLSSLNLKNGQNTKLDWFSVNFTKNPSLSCIQVDDVAYSNDNWNGKLDKTSFFAVDCSSFTLIPDANFEQALIDLKIDIDGKNGKVLTSSIAVVKDLNVELNEIADLTGIEGFASLEFLNCQFNDLTSLNLSKNLNLIELYCHGNLLTALDVAANKNLTTLQANKNKIKSLDISKNTSLVYINASENALGTLNLKNGNNTNFTTAFMFSNTALKCITVDNPSFASTSGVFFKDAAASYSDSCSLGLSDSVFNHAVVYPNPTKGEVTIDNVSLEKATVYNSLGQLVKSFTLDTANSSNTINLSGLPKGIYYVYLINQDASSAKKIIVE